MKHIVFLTFILHAYGIKNLPQVELPSGTIEGSRQTIINGRKIFAFEGVPYARPPVGKYRFREPIPVKPWEGIWEAKTIYKCMQYNQYTEPGEDFVIGDEDCLYMNIYTPKLDAKANLNAIVYIHGGAFMFNYGGQQGPDMLLEKDVVFVNFNYRLGPLGFLSTEDDELPGNIGLKDQIFALKWIKNNIKLFGGNPNSITISGMSAGGASVHLHYLMPKSKGLFNRGISQSGTALCPWVLMENPLEKTKKMAALLGCPTANTKELIKCLKYRPGRQIVDSVKEFQPWLYNPFSPFGVVVDSWASDPVLPQHPYILLKNNQINDLPWMASQTSSEGLYPGSSFYQHLDDIENRWNELMPFILDYNYTVDLNLHNTVGQKIRDQYMKGKKLTKSTFMNLVQILSDRHFDIEKYAQLQASIATSPVYFYYFSYRGTNSWSAYRSGTNEDFGPSHADDTSYVFKSKLDTLSTENDRTMSKLFVDIFSSFAQKGKPEISVDWSPVSKKLTDDLIYLEIASPKQGQVDFNNLMAPANREFWNSLPIKENEKLFNLKDEL